MTCCSLHLCSCDKHQDQQHLEEERVHFVWLSSSSRFTTEESQGRSSSREHGGMLLIPHFPWLKLSYLSFANQELLPRGGTTHSRLAIKKTSCRHAHRSISWRQCLSWGSLFPGGSVYGKLTIKTDRLVRFPGSPKSPAGARDHFDSCDLEMCVVTKPHCGHKSCESRERWKKGRQDPDTSR